MFQRNNRVIRLSLPKVKLCNYMSVVGPCPLNTYTQPYPYPHTPFFDFLDGSRCRISELTSVKTPSMVTGIKVDT